MQKSLNLFIFFFFAVISILVFGLFDQVWDRINPGLVSEFDAPYSVPGIAPRPLLILNGKNHVAFVDLQNFF